VHRPCHSFKEIDACRDPNPETNPQAVAADLCRDAGLLPAREGYLSGSLKAGMKARCSSTGKAASASFERGQLILYGDHPCGQCSE